MAYGIVLQLTQRYLDTNSNYVGLAGDMKSTSSYTFILGSVIFSWASKKQVIVAQSIIKAEYIVVAMTSRQAIWLKIIFEDIRKP